MVVCRAATMVGVEKMIGIKILKCSVCTSLGIGLATVYQRETTTMYLDCMGRSEWFMFDLQNPFLPFIGGSGINVKLFHPFRLSVNSVAFAFVLVVPVLYYKIFQFRKKQDINIRGKIISK